MVLHISADAGKVDDKGNVGLLEEGGGTDTAALQDLGRVEGAGGEDDFLPGLDGSDLGLGVGYGVPGLHVDAGGLLLVKRDGIDAPPNKEVKVLALGYGGVVSGAGIRAGAGAVIDGALFTFAWVSIVVNEEQVADKTHSSPKQPVSISVITTLLAFRSQLLETRPHRLKSRVLNGVDASLDRSILAIHLLVPGDVELLGKRGVRNLERRALDEVGQEAIESPAGVAELLPVVIVVGSAAVEEHAVDGGATVVFMSVPGLTSEDGIGKDVPSNDSSCRDVLNLVCFSQLGLWNRSQVVLGVRGIAEHLLDIEDIVGVVEVAILDNKDGYC